MLCAEGLVTDYLASHARGQVRETKMKNEGWFCDATELKIRVRLTRVFVCVRRSRVLSRVCWPTCRYSLEQRAEKVQKRRSTT